MSQTFKASILASSIVAALGSLSAPAAFAADVNVLDPVTVSVKSGAYRNDNDKNSASAVAPTQSSLEATQPQSIITREFIEKSVAPTAEYSRVVNVAPSVSGDSANGPGLSETKTTMRGFSDDQYNITFDGIPWGDTNNPAHHSTSFFPASVIGGAVVERGPGNASNLGFATFGGSINLFSKKPGQERAVSVFGSTGNWNTSLIGTALESGRLEALGGATVGINFQHLQSDGYLTHNDIKSDNLTLKFEQPLGANNTLTLFSSVNKIHYTQPDNSKGPTRTQIALYGKNFSLNSDPTSFNYYGYNHTTKDTDFEYARLKSNWSEHWSTEAQVYTYAYNNQTISADPTGATAFGTKLGPVGNRNIPGIDKQNKYRVYGGIFKAEDQLGAGLMRVGLWTEKSDTDRHQYDIDVTQNNARNPIETKPVPVQFPSVLFDQKSNIKTNQPFAEFEWQAADDVVITPGFKEVFITRSVDAIVNQTTRVPQNTSVDYRAALPFLTVNKQLEPGLAAYAQFAKGFQIPDLKSFYIIDPTHNSSVPQKSTNYQFGVVNKAGDLTWDADIYRIDFKNKYVSNGLGGTAAAYVNVGGAQYKGIEGQITYVIGSGLALYANGSLNRAIATDTGKTISGAPVMTAAAGVLYSVGSWSTSFIAKRTGESYQSDYDATKPANYEFYKAPGYNNADLGVSYTLRNIGFGAKAVKLQANVFNVFNQRGILSISPGKTQALDQFTFLAPRSYQISVKADF
jgi:iron complex outermembrane receptor protein